MSLDLSVNYGGLILHSPIVVGSCPMTVDDQTRLSLESAGAGAIVLPSIFEEQVSVWNNSSAEVSSRQEHQHRLRTKVDTMDAKSYLALVNRSSNQLAIPVIASINGGATECCVDFAGELQEAGAAGIELNIHCGDDREFKGSGEIEDSLLSSMEAYSQSISVPLFAKLDHSGVSLPHFARRCCSGVAGIVLHGRSPEVDICLDTLGLCSKWNLTPPSTSIGLIEPIMRLHSHCPAMSIAASGGIATCEGVAKVLLAGADVAMITSELYRSGPDSIRTIIDGLIVFLERHHFSSLRELQMERPIEFACDEARSLYVSALSNRLHAPSQSGRNRGNASAERTRPEPSYQEPCYRELGHQECDRWGHLIPGTGEATASPK